MPLPVQDANGQRQRQASPVSASAISHANVIHAMRCAHGRPTRSSARSTHAGVTRTRSAFRPVEAEHSTLAQPAVGVPADGTRPEIVPIDATDATVDQDDGHGRCMCAALSRSFCCLCMQRLQIGEATTHAAGTLGRGEKAGGRKTRTLRMAGSVADRA